MLGASLWSGHSSELHYPSRRDLVPEGGLVPTTVTAGILCIRLFVRGGGVVQQPHLWEVEAQNSAGQPQGEGALRGPFVEDRTPSSDLLTPKVHPTPTPWALDFWHINSGDTHIQSTRSPRPVSP